MSHRCTYCRYCAEGRADMCCGGRICRQIGAIGEVAKDRMAELHAAIQAESDYLTMAELINLDSEARLMPGESHSTELELSISLSIPSTPELPAAPADTLLSKLQSDIHESIPVERANHE